jgi:hypothetical protein
MHQITNSWAMPRTSTSKSAIAAAMIPAAILPDRRMSHGRLLPGEREIGCFTCLPLSV